MDRSEAGRSAPAEATSAQRAMQVAAWRQLWRLLLQPTGDEPLADEAALDQEASDAEVTSAVIRNRRAKAPASTGADEIHPERHTRKGTIS